MNTKSKSLFAPGWFFVAAGLALPAVGVRLAAAEPSAAADKSGYHLFKPTPSSLLREMSTDRPDKTESPYTVDAGHFQIEMDLVNYSYTRIEDGPVVLRDDSWAVAPFNVKAGLCNRVDLQLVLAPWQSSKTELRTGFGPALRSRTGGFGDLVTRLKWNLWGNDGGRTALAVMPFVKFPTAERDVGNRSYEGGIILPLAVELPEGFGMGVMSQFDLREDAGGNGHHLDFINSITFNRGLTEKLGAYVEFFSAVTTDPDLSDDESEWIGTLDIGATYTITENIQLDAGVNFGVTRLAPDINPFLGISWRY